MWLFLLGNLGFLLQNREEFFFSGITLLSFRRGAPLLVACLLSPLGKERCWGRNWETLNTEVKETLSSEWDTFSLDLRHVGIGIERRLIQIWETLSSELRDAEIFFLLEVEIGNERRWGRQWGREGERESLSRCDMVRRTGTHAHAHVSQSNQ